MVIPARENVKEVIRVWNLRRQETLKKGSQSILGSLSYSGGRGAAKGTFMEEMIFMFQKGHSEDRVRNALERDRETSKEGIRVI